MFQEHLDGRSGATAEPVVGADGDTRSHRRARGRKLELLFGSVIVERESYGARGYDSLRPLDAELNLPPESFSHGIRKHVAREAAKSSYDEVVQSLNDNAGLSIPKRQAEQLAQRAAQDFDAFYEQRRTPHQHDETGPILVMSTDAKGIVMRSEELRPATKRVAARSENKLRHRLSKGEKRGRKRMSQVATVYTIGTHYRGVDDIVGSLDSVGPPLEVVSAPSPRPKPEDKRVWASVEPSAEDVIEQMVAEAIRRDSDGKKHGVVLVDGNMHQLDCIQKHLAKHGRSATIIIDIIHVLEYIWKASHALHGEGSENGESWVTERLRQLLEGEVSHVAAGIRRSATLRNLVGNRRKAVDTCADYLLKYSDYMKFDEYLAAGLPIATGVIEGAYRHLVKDRMDITGARWSTPGAEAVTQLRALRTSGDFEEYWEFHEGREHERNHLRHYAGN